MKECNEIRDDRQTAPVPPPVPKAEQADDWLDPLIEGWWADHFPGSAVARDTAAWNVAHAAKETLKRLLVSARAQGQIQSHGQVSPQQAANKDLQGSI
jgi:hypothetical protein